MESRAERGGERKTISPKERREGNSRVEAMVTSDILAVESKKLGNRLNVED